MREPGEGEESGGRSKQWRMFDRALLAAEVASALVVTWLVAQYIYTAYIDTTPHRVGSSRGATAPSVLAGPTHTATATQSPATLPTATLVSQVAPPVEGPAQGGTGSKSDDTGPPAFAPPPDGWPGTVTPLPTGTPTSTPTATPTVDPQLLLPSRLRIPVMFLDSPVEEVHVSMGVWQTSPMNIGHLEGSGNPGGTGNVVLAAHRDINSALFRDLDRLEQGDEVFVSNALREYRYIVTDTFVVTPSHTEVMDPTSDKRVTLITCTPVGLATQRLVVTAALDESYTGK